MKFALFIIGMLASCAACLADEAISFDIGLSYVLHGRPVLAQRLRLKEGEPS